jgi:hypothetical protein
VGADGNGAPSTTWYLSTSTASRKSWPTATGIRNRRNRRGATATVHYSSSRHQSYGPHTPSTKPPNDNRLLPVEDLFADDNTLTEPTYLILIRRQYYTNAIKKNYHYYSSSPHHGETSHLSWNDQSHTCRGTTRATPVVERPERLVPAPSMSTVDVVFTLLVFSFL